MINKDDLFPFTGEAVGALRVLFRQGFLFSFFFLLLGASGTWLFWNLVSKVGLVLGLKCPYVLSNVWPSHSTPLLFMWSIPRSILPGYSVGVGRVVDFWFVRIQRHKESKWKPLWPQSLPGEASDKLMVFISSWFSRRARNGALTVLSFLNRLLALYIISALCWVEVMVISGFAF